MTLPSPENIMYVDIQSLWRRVFSASPKMFMKKSNTVRFQAEPDGQGAWLVKDNFRNQLAHWHGFALSGLDKLVAQARAELLNARDDQARAGSC
jgi:hypothetical protein